LRGVGGVVDESGLGTLEARDVDTGDGEVEGGGEIVEIGKADGMVSSIGSEGCPWWSSSSFWRLEGA